MAGGWPSLPFLRPFGRLSPPAEIPPPEIVFWRDTLPESQYTLQLGSGQAYDTRPIVASAGGHVRSGSVVSYALARAMGSLWPAGRIVGQNYLAGPIWECFQGNYAFDLSAIPAGSTILSALATLTFSANDSVTDFILEMRAYGWSDADGEGIPGASLSSYTLLASVDTSTFGVGGAIVADLTSEAAFATALQAAGDELRVNLSSSRQRLGNTPAGLEHVTLSDSAPPRLRVTYRASGGDEVTLEIDAESLIFGSGMRGFASLECEADLETCNDVVSNQLVVGRDVVLFDNGVACWEGEVVSLPRPSPDDPVQQIICAGRWDRARRNESYGKWFVSDSTYERWKELPVRLLGNPGLLSTRLEAISVDTDRQLLITIPNGTVAKVGQGVALGLWLFDGEDAAASFSRVTCDVSVDPGATQWIFELFTAKDLYGGPQAPIRYLGSYSAAAFNDKIDTNISSDGARALILYATAAANHTAAQDYYIQLRNLVVYAGTQAARRIDEAIVEILEGDSGIAASAQSEPIGAALANLVIDPDDTIAGAVEKIEARHSLPVLAGIWDDGELVVQEQPTAPTDRTRYYEVSVAQEGVVWDVQADEEAAVEVVKVVYEAKPENDCGQPNPVDATWPSDWYRSSATNCYAHDNGDGWQFWLQSDSTALNPSAIYKPSGGSGSGIAVEAGVTYLVRARVRNYAYDAGTSRFRINWYDSSLTLLSGNNAWSVTAADGTEHWVEKAIIAPVNAAWAQLVLEWSGVSGTVNQALRARDVELRPFVDTDVELVEYVPAPPSSQTERMVTLRAGYRTRAEAIAAGEQYLEHYGSRASGPVQIPDFVRDIDGRLWPLSRIRAWDWVICTDYHDPDARGPFMVTGVEIRDGLAMLAIGGVDTYAYDPPEKAQARRGRFIGGKFVWKKVRRKVRGRWRWVKRKVWRKARYL